MTEVYAGCYFPRTRTFNYDLTQNQCTEQDGVTIYKETEKTNGANPAPESGENEPTIGSGGW